jgi:hypothetical protein
MKTFTQFLPPAWTMQVLQWFRNGLYKLRMHMVPGGIALFEIVHDFWYARALGVAAELDIAGLLKEKPLHIDQLAALTQTHPPSLYRLMRTLASRGVFRETEKNVFHLTSLARALLDKEDGMKYLIQSHTSVTQLQNFGELLHCVRTGENAYVKRFNTHAFDFMTANPAEAAVFNKGMSNASRLFAKALLSAYSFRNFKKIVDVGGGNGVLLFSILSRYSSATGILFDLPHVIENIDFSLHDGDKISSRLQLSVGDFFENLPSGADLYILKNVLHDWDDSHCILLLNKIRSVIEKGSRLLVIESIIPEGNTPSFGKMMDLLMLTGTQGGRERTLAEYKKLFAEAQLHCLRVVHTVAPFSVMEAIKKEMPG